MAPIPVYVKGGIWSNLEDQIVKAAIQKYGTHQWSKIASLLQKKSAKQCEIRWNEYLNPKINFSEFSKEEDVRLLDLARKLPNQWRSIADAMGRTAQVCIDRYNKLLEGNDDDTDLRLSSSLEFKVGDLNPKSETLVAKPDDHELAEDEREMLAEARARLLNTQGKKATRKIRERMLEESKRIAQLQKRRELKQAGVKTNIKQGKKRYATELDYNEDVVYEQLPPPGIYDTKKEDERLAKEFSSFENKVQKRGLRDNSNIDTASNREKKRQSLIAGNKKLKADNGTILTNEYKKPVLSLPSPGTKGSSYARDFELKKQKLLANSQTGTVFRSQTSSMEAVPEPQIRQTFTQDVGPGRSLRELFALLPEPKNDFEIALEDDVVESDEEEDRGLKNGVRMDEDSEGSEGSILSADTRALDLECLKLKKFPLPAFAENPQNSFEQTYNELLACSIIDEPYLQSSDLQHYLGLLEDEIKITKVPVRDSAPTVISLPERAALLESIESKLESLRGLQKELMFVEPLIQYNETLSEKVCGAQLSLVRSLQHRYFVNYKMYQNELKGIQERSERLKHDLERSA